MNAKTGKTSIVARFNRVLILLYLASLLASLPAVYYITRHQAISAAQGQLNLLVDTVISLRQFVTKDIRPVVREAGIMHPPAVSGVVATAHLARYLGALQPGYYIKIASDNPLNPRNKASPLEQSLLERFRKNRSLDSIIEIGPIADMDYLVSARPSVSETGCMLCHGDPAAAPKEITALHPASGKGYGYKLNEVVGANVVGVPLGNVMAVAMERAAVVAAALTVLFAVLMLAINLLVRKHIIQPVLEIAESAHAVSRGDMERRIESDRNDEIGDLARSFELLRRSLAAAMRRLKT